MISSKEITELIRNNEVEGVRDLMRSGKIALTTEVESKIYFSLFFPSHFLGSHTTLDPRPRCVGIP